VVAALAVQGWHGPDLAHDLVSAALFAGLPLDDVTELADLLMPPDAWDPWRAMVEAQLAEARGQTAAAQSGYASIADSGILPPHVRATAEAGYARCLFAQGRLDDAQSHVRTATALLERWSGWRVADVRQLRAALGLAPSGQPAGAPTLTPREREVALLIADGLTNAELARRLYISPKTAAVHVSSILRKLGVTSRTEVAAHVNITLS
jgi:DNA-binding NarL/FixJ family response regulator